MSSINIVKKTRKQFLHLDTHLGSYNNQSLFILTERSNLGDIRLHTGLMFNPSFFGRCAGVFFLTMYICAYIVLINIEKFSKLRFSLITTIC